MGGEEKVSCPTCKTTYWVDKKYLADPAARFKCSHCQSVFSRSDTLPPPRSPKKFRSAKRQEPPALFEDHVTATDSDRSERTEEEAEEEPEEEPQRPPSLDTARRTARKSEAASRARSADSDFVFDSPSEWDIGDDMDRVSSSPARKGLSARRSDQLEEASKVRAVVIVLGMIVAAYGAFAATLVAQPEKAQRMVEQIPLIGRGLGEERLYVRRMQLIDVRASVQELRGGRRVLVVSGRVVNRNPVALRDVQIFGSGIDAQGRVRDQKRVFCGNVVTVRMLRDLNAQEISMLQQNPPSREFVLRPGEAADFVIVLFNGAQEISQARVEVASVRR